MDRRVSKVLAGVLIVVLVAGCGSNRADRARHVVARAASGPIASACMVAGRGGATRARCGCVQSVADVTLTGSDQRLGASFFSDPHRAQEIRQSDNASHEAFWKRWKDFGATAAQQCK